MYWRKGNLLSSKAKSQTQLLFAICFPNWVCKTKALLSLWLYHQAGSIITRSFSRSSLKIVAKRLSFLPTIDKVQVTLYHRKQRTNIWWGSPNYVEELVPTIIVAVVLYLWLCTCTNPRTVQPFVIWKCLLSEIASLVETCRWVKKVQKMFEEEGTTWGMKFDLGSFLLVNDRSF